MKPLENITVLDFSQFLSAPSAALKLADLGANVIKIERPDTGDICRTLYISNCVIDGDSSLFHAINRGVAKHLGIDFDSVCKINPEIVYGDITGYGTSGPWKDLPGQDLLVQSLSGLAWLNGNANQPPMPFGLSIADMCAGQHLAQGILAGLIQSKTKKEPVYVQTNLLESILDLQFEVFTTYLNDGHQNPVRSTVNNANAYGIYKTADGYIALAMVPIPYLGELIHCSELTKYTDPSLSDKRDEIKSILSKHLITKTTSHWLSLLEPADIWCADVYTWEKLLESDGFKELDMIQKVSRDNGTQLFTTRCPITIDGERFINEKAAPSLGANNAKYHIN